MLIDVNRLSIEFGGNFLFKDISFRISAGDKIALIGRNGVGKTSLIKMLANEDISKSLKEIYYINGISIGFLKQQIAYDNNLTVKDTVITNFVNIPELEKKIQNLQHEISLISTELAIEDNRKLFDDLEKATIQLNEYLSGNFEKKLEKTLLGLGFERLDFGRKINEFSGGWKMRVELAKLLMADHDLLLLDEPTNHLDIESIIWFEGYLKSFKGAMLLISHDKRFLDNVTNRTIEISNQRIIDYKLKYSDYIEKRRVEKEMLIASAKEQGKYIKKTEELINKFRAKKNKAAFAQSLIKKLDKLDKVEVESNASDFLNIRFPLANGGYKVLLEMEDMSKSFPDKILFKNADLIIARGERIALIGKNGIGKSTLLKIITGKEGYEGKVRVPEGVEIGYFAQNQTEMLDPSKTVLSTIEDVLPVGSGVNPRSLLGAFLFSNDDVDKKVKVLSGGEKMRLALCKMIITPVHLLILDEPTNHLDIQAKDVLKQALLKFKGTVLLVSHDREFLSGLTSCVYEIFDKRVRIHNSDIDTFLINYQSGLNDSFPEKPEKVNIKNIDKNIAESRNNEYFSKKQRSKELRILEKAIGKNERDIEKLEAEIERTEEIISQNTGEKDFDWPEYSTKLNNLNSDLNRVIEEWENNCNELERMKKEQ